MTQEKKEKRREIERQGSPRPAGRTALITGATSGIGLALALRLVREGYCLVLVASRREGLVRAAARLKRECLNGGGTWEKGRVFLICQDLSEEGAAGKVYAAVRAKGIRVDLLVNNAGIGVVGAECENDRAKVGQMLRVNILAVTELCGLFARDMCMRGFGKILNVSSTGAFQPGPYTAAYFASKAYVDFYSRALRYEMAGKGVQVCTLYPGTTKTDFFARAGQKTPIWAMAPEKVAKQAYSGLVRNRERIVPGLCNQLLRAVPSGLKLRGVAYLKKAKK